MNNKLFNKWYSWLILIIILGAALRFYDLGKTPQVFNRDELADGYNAYSILKTGKDEYGVKLPLWMLSIGDYKPPVYIYLTSLSIKLFGFNEFSLRFLSALCGTLLLPVCFLLVKELLDDFNDEFKIRVALFLAFILSISPWHFFYSRQVFEESPALLFSLTGLYCFLKVRKNHFFLLPSFVLFVLAIFTYNPPLFILPILLPVTLIFFSKDYFQKKKSPIIAFLLVFYVFVSGYFFVSKSLITGRSEATIFQPLYLETQVSNIRNNPKDFILKEIISRKKPFIVYKFVSNYLSSFKPNFLFFGGDYHLWHGLRWYGLKVGNFYLVTLILFIIGIYFIFKKKKKDLIFILVWLLITPIPCSLTQDAPNTNRLHEFLFLILIISSIGFTYLIKISRKSSKYVIIVVSLILVASSLNYFDFYFTKFNRNYCDYPFRSMNICGFKTITDFIKKNPRYEKFIFVTETGSEEIYLQLAFYLKFNPLDFQKFAVRQKNGFIYVNEFKNYYFLAYYDDKPLIKLKKLSKEGRNLYIIRNNFLFNIETLIKKGILKKRLFTIKDKDNNLLWIVAE